MTVVLNIPNWLNKKQHTIKLQLSNQDQIHQSAKTTNSKACLKTQNTKFCITFILFYFFKRKKTILKSTILKK